MNRKILAKWRVGSHLYGLNTSESDEDFIGIFMPTSEDLLGLKTMEEIDNSTKSSKTMRRNTREDTDEKLYSLKKYTHLAMQNNPNILEVIFADNKNTLVMTPEFQELIDNKDKIISQKVFYSFTGYAFSQKKKLIVKKERYLNLVEGIQLIEKTWSSKLGHKRQLTVPDAELLTDWLSYHKGAKHTPKTFHLGMDLDVIYDQLTRERDNYGWRVHTDSFDKLGYDVKFGYHLIRILEEGYQLLNNNEIVFPFQGEAKKDIMRIREGLVDYKELIEMFDIYNGKCEAAFKTTSLLKKPDFNFVNDWLVNTIEKGIVHKFKGK